MLGYEVTPAVLDARSAEAVLALREAFRKVENITKWLANHPSDGTTDPLTLDPYNKTVDEAYALRSFFETFNSVRENNQATLDTGRKMTGLE